METKKQIKNWNPTKKELLAIYECPNCGRNDASIVPPIMKVRLPFFIQCGCGGWVLYSRAWICEPYKASDVFVGFIANDEKIIHALKFELKEVTDKLDPDGTMMDPNVMMRDPKFMKEIEHICKDEESKEKMYT